MAEELFIIDGTSCIYRSFHAIPHLSTSDGMPTNAVYGFAQTLRKILNTYSPSYVGIALDARGPSFRHEMFEQYKSERPPMPDDLSMQLPLIKDLIGAFNIPLMEKDGFEADDIIATLAERLAKKGIRIVIVTSDKDMFQLVDDGIVVYDYTKDRFFDRKAVLEKLGVAPECIPDFLALVGDRTDFIPGVRGIGEKTARRLIAQYGTIENLYAHLDEITPRRVKEALEEGREAALLSKGLATLRKDVPLECPLQGLARKEPDYRRLATVLKRLEFSRLIEELIPSTMPDVRTENIEDEEAMKVFLKEVCKAGRVSVSLHGKDHGIEDTLYLYAGGDVVWQIEGKEARWLREILEAPGLLKLTDDAKGLWLYGLKNGVDIRGDMVDVTIASYLLNPAQSHRLEDISYNYTELRFDATRMPYLRAYATWHLSDVLTERLKEDGLFRLFRELEMPLTEVIASMEERGIRLDTDGLERVSVELTERLKEIEEGIYHIAGYRLNLNSHRQLAHLLFEKLGLKPVKKTRTGYSTDEAVLTILSRYHEIPGAIIEYRQLSKLKNTYVDGLLSLVDERGRIHTTFNQTVTATGRLSSSNPNLQNIPVKGELADRIRSCFVAEDGYMFLSGDYSQIELRIVAHLSGDEGLLEAFRKGEDIHRKTASEVFGVMPGLVTSEMRRRAKAINFGIIYGMGPHGLSQELGIDVRAAKEYIERYFEHYKKVRLFIEHTIEEARERGYTETIFGRRRYVPELRSTNDNVRRAGERIAINTPVQGSCADIIKMAMIRVHRRLEEEGLCAHQILQIHDELLLEVREDALDRVKAVLKEEMEGVVELSVPLEVKVGVGRNWLEAG